MKKLIFLTMLLWGIGHNTCAQQFRFPVDKALDSLNLSKEISSLAEQVLSLQLKDQNMKLGNNELFRLQMLAGRYEEAVATINTMRKDSREKDANLLFLQYELYGRAKIGGNDFLESFQRLFREQFKRLNNQSALNISTAFKSRNGVSELNEIVQKELSSLKTTDSLSFQGATSLCLKYFVAHVFQAIEPVAVKLLDEEDQKRYLIEDSVLIKTSDGATLSAVIVRQSGITGTQPAALFFFIYSDLNQSLYEAKQSAAHGYVGVVADTRGKRLSPDEIAPYEHEARDVNSVIDWISRQPWSNGEVGMYGGSYSGFAQWAAAKYLHPALKTIVPYVAAIPGQGLPMENNVFLNANYGWAFYVTNNKYLDNKVYDNRERWTSMEDKWYAEGKAYNKIDSIDGTPNKWLQKWLTHPSYDRYWQEMVPYKHEFAKINIPVLSITGYYDDGQISALQYMKDHYKYNPSANHYLIIGPYDHFGAQRGGFPVLRGYQVDPVALINTREITYQWLDYTLKGGRKPEILKGKVNYQVMGTNTWRHVENLEKLNEKNLTFYLDNTLAEEHFKLSLLKPVLKGYLSQEVDFKDRKSQSNEYYPFPVIKDQLERGTGLFFMTEPFKDNIVMSGTFSGELKAVINKKDMDIGVSLYEVMPDGKYFCLSYYLGRASYARDLSKRELLKPGKMESIPFERTRMVARQLQKGSRLLVVLNINKNTGAQINYGTGKDVSDETIDDAAEPLRIKWFNDSFIRIPVE